MAGGTGNTTTYGAWLLVLSAFAGLVIALINLFNQGNGIAYSFGAYLVVGSTVLLLLAALALAAYHAKPRVLSGILAFLALLDLLGTGAAAWFLQSYVLVGAMAVGLVGWLVYVVIDPSDQQIAARETHTRTA